MSWEEADLKLTVPFFLVGQIWSWNQASTPEARSTDQCPRWTLVSLRVGVTFVERIGGVGNRAIKQLQKDDEPYSRIAVKGAFFFAALEMLNPQASLCSSSGCIAFSQ